MAVLGRFFFLAVTFFAITGLLIVFGVFDRCSRSASEAAIAEEIKDIPPTFNVTAGQLVRTYRADEQAVAIAYDGSVGIVEAPTMVHKAANYLKLHAYDVWSVRCFTSDEEIDKVSALSRPENRSADSRPTGYVIIGRGGVSTGQSRPIFAFKGKIEGVNDKHLSVDMRGCTLQDPQ